VSAPLPYIVVGRAGERQLLQGWHEREADGRNGIPYRASAPEGELVLEAVPGATKLHVLVSAPVGLAGHPLEGRIVFNKQKFALPLAIDHWMHRVFPLESKRDVLQVRLYLKEGIVPDSILHNGDPRKLGVFLSAIWQE
jgi:hypothetical protein